MAIEIAGLTEYSGTYASYFLLPATFGMDTIQKGIIHVEDGIRKKKNVGRVDFTNPLQARKATPVQGDSSFAITQRTLEPDDLMLYAEFNPRDFESTFLAEEWNRQNGGVTLLSRALPQTIESFMMQIALNRAFEQVENGIWMGSKTYTAEDGSVGNGQIKYFDGLLKKMVSDAAVKKVASPLPLVATASVASTSTNILEAMDALISLAVTNKKALFTGQNKKYLKFLISIEDEQLYQKASINLTFKGQLIQIGETQPYKGFEVVAIAGLPKDTIVFTRATDGIDSNLWLGMNSTEDNNLMLARTLPNSEMFFIKGLMKYDAQYGYSEEVFLFTTLTAGTFTA